MSFEKVVLAKVAKVVKADRTAEFKYGTLFVECDSKQAAKIETTLLDYLKCGIIVSKIGNEFSFDFV